VGKTETQGEKRGNPEKKKKERKAFNTKNSWTKGKKMGQSSGARRGNGAYPRRRLMPDEGKEKFQGKAAEKRGGGEVLLM